MINKCNNTQIINKILFYNNLKGFSKLMKNKGRKLAFKLRNGTLKIPTIIYFNNKK